jgi:hypothetical protein
MAFFGPITSNIINITLIISFIIGIPLGFVAIFHKAEFKKVNDEYVMVDNTKLNLGISAIVLVFTPILFLILGGTNLLN